MKHQVVAAFALFLLAGCVKEARTDCPCYLTLDLDRVIGDRTYSDAVATLAPCEDGQTAQNRILLYEYEGIGYERKVKKRLVNVSVVCGFKNGVFSDSCYVVAENCQSDPIMAYAEGVDCEGERASAEVRLHKQYCRVRFVFAGLPEGERYPYGLRVTAGCNALNLYDLVPVEGAFSAEAVEDVAGDVSVTLPRQKSSVMKLDILDLSGETVHTMDLGAAFRSMGYNWTKTDLDDVSVRIDYAKAELMMEILPWENCYETVDL